MTHGEGEKQRRESTGFRYFALQSD